MSRLGQCHLIDILSSIDLSLLEGEFPEMDLSNEDILSMHTDQTLTQELGLKPEEDDIPKRRNSRKRRLAVLSGIAAGSIAVGGVIVFMCKKYELLKKIA